MANLTFQWEGDINVVGGEVKKDGVPISAGSSGTTIEDIKGNYIDNSNFSINTNGEEEYVYTDTTIYTVDRWYIDGGILAPKGNGVQFTNTNTNSGTENLIRLKQNIPYSFDVFAGKTLTLSAKINGTIYSGAATLPEEKPTTGTDSTTAVQYIAVGTTNFGVNLNYSITGDYFVPYIALAYNQSVEIEWVKLEIGDSATPYVAPDYTTEKIKTEFMSDNGNISMPYTKEEIDTKVDEIEEQIDGINSTSLTVKVNDKDFLMETREMTRSEQAHVVMNYSSYDPIIEIENFVFINDMSRITVKDKKSFDNTIGQITPVIGGTQVQSIACFAIIPSMQERQGGQKLVFNLYVVDSNTNYLYAGVLRLQDCIISGNWNVNVDRILQLDPTPYCLTQSKNKVYCLAGGSISIFSGTDIRNFEIQEFETFDHEIDQIKCDPNGEVFVHLTKKYDTGMSGWCHIEELSVPDLNEIKWDPVGMCQKIDDTEEIEFIELEDIFRWKDYIIGTSNGVIYYYHISELRSRHVTDYGYQYIYAHKFTTNMFLYSSNVFVSDDYIVVNNISGTAIYSEFFVENHVYANLPNQTVNNTAAKRKSGIRGVIDTVDGLYIIGTSGQVKVLHRTYELDLQSAINYLR